MCYLFGNKSLILEKIFLLIQYIFDFLWDRGTYRKEFNPHFVGMNVSQEIGYGWKLEEYEENGST